jgi:hypothetical protein
MLKNSIACFQEFRLSFVQFNVSYCGVPLPEAGIKLLFSTIGRSLFKVAFQELQIQGAAS